MPGSDRRPICVPMRAVREVLFRALLRTCWGRSYWHHRKNPPDFHCDYDHRRMLFSRGAYSLRAGWYSALRGTERGRCHIVLSGPSVSGIREPHHLGGACSIWANGSPALAVAAGITPSFYVVTDGGFFRRRRDDYLRYARLAMANLINFNGVSELLRFASPAGEFHVFDDPASPWHRARPTKRSGRLESGENANCLRVGSSVAITCLRAAMDLGFTEIYVFGLDLGGGGEPRFYRELKPEPSRLLKDHDEIVGELREIAGWARQQDVRIVNCALSSRLAESVFPKADPNDILAAISRT